MKQSSHFVCKHCLHRSPLLERTFGSDENQFDRILNRIALADGLLDFR